MEHFATQRLNIVQHYYEYLIILEQKLCGKTWYSSRYVLSDFETSCRKIYIRKYLKQFSTKRPDIIQNFSCLVFRTKSFKICIRKYLKQFSTQRLDLAQNLPIPSSPEIFQGAKCANILILNTTVAVKAIFLAYKVGP